MLKRSKIILAVSIGIYLLALSAAATALIVSTQEQLEGPVFNGVKVVRNAFGRPGLKLTGQGLSPELQLMLLPDTISSDRLRASSLDKGNMFDVEVAGDYLMVARGSYGMEVYNRHHEPILAIEAHLDLGGRVVDLEADGDTLFALLSKPARLAKISIKNPLKPVLIDSVEFPGMPTALLVHEQSLYVTDSRQGLWHLSADLKVIASPDHFAGLDSSWKMAISGDQLLVAALDGRLWQLPINQADSAPVLIKTFNRHVMGVAADATGVYVQLQDGCLQSFRLGRGGTLDLIQEFFTSKQHAHVAGVSLWDEGRILIALDSSRGAVIYRREHDGALSLLGNVLQSGKFIAVALEDDMLYASSSRGLSAWSLKDLSTTLPAFTSRISAGNIYTLERWENVLVAKSRVDGVQLYDLERPDSPPRELTNDDISAATVSSGHLWLARSGQPLAGFDLTQDLFTEPCWTLPDVKDVTLISNFGKHVLLAVEGGVSIYSSEDPCHPRLLTRFPVENSVSDFLLDGDYIYVTSGKGKDIIVFNWRPDTEAKLVGRYTLPAPLREFCSPRRLCKYEDKLYVSMGRVGVLALDVSNPSDLEQFFYLDTPGYSGHLHVHDGVLYVADLYAGLRLIDLEASEESGVPRVIGSYRTALDPQDVMFIDDSIFIAGGVKGMVRVTAPLRLRPEHAETLDAFIPLPKGYLPGRYRLLAYNEAGHLSEDLLVTLPEF